MVVLQMIVGRRAKLAAVGVALTLMGCGQKGPLTLPQAFVGHALTPAGSPAAVHGAGQAVASERPASDDAAPGAAV